MCIGSGDRKPFGFLFKNQQNQFIYSCSRCDEEFNIGIELEQHTVVHEIKDELENSIPYEPAIFETFASKLSTDDLQNEQIAMDISTKDEMAIYLPFETPKLEVNIVEEITKFPHSKSKDDSNNSNIPEDNSHQNVDPESNESSSSDDLFEEKRTESKTKPKPERTPTKKREYICEICERRFTSLARIKQHIHAGHIKDKKTKSKRSTTPTICSICGKSIRDIKTHLRIFHSDERPFKCDYCSATFKQKVHRDTHIRQHTGEKPFMCHACGRSYHAQSVLKSHMNRYHYHLKPHKCDQCGNSYRQLYELRDHINLHHLNQKLYPCQVCDRRFGTRKHLHQHMLSHGEKRFQCKFCEQKFATTSGRRGHEIRNHGAI